jgi:hypothetical protein
MKVLVRKQLNGSLMPADDVAQEALRKVKPGIDCWIELRVARHPRFHRLYFALIKLTFDNQERYTNAEQFRKAVQMAAGHVDELVGLDGAIYQIPRSIAWDQLDETEFGELFPQVMRVCATILGEMDVDVLREEVERYAA